MIDIIDFNEKGMQLLDTQTEKAANILSVQLGALEYAQDLGIDLRYFMTEKTQFQNESFKAYLVQILASRGINVSSIQTVINALDTNFNIKLSPEENSTGMIAR